MFYEFRHFGLSEHFCKEYGSNFSYPGHLHQSFELITVLDGEMHVKVDNKEYDICKNQAVLVFPNQIHSMTSSKCEHMLCIFSPEIVQSFFALHTGKMPLSNKFCLGDDIVNAINELTEDNSLIKKKSVLYAACSEFDDTAEYICSRNTDSELLFRIFEFVENNYNKDCSLDALSVYTSFSYAYLSRYFKNATDISFNEYVNMYRVGKACYMLNNTDCSVLRCAMECGFSSLRSFNRNFKLHTSTTPKLYRLNTR